MFLYWIVQNFGQRKQSRYPYFCINGRRNNLRQLTSKQTTPAKKENNYVVIKKFPRL